ncbi:MAG TPA: hypothetical protein VGN69_08330 [Solirubrobacteraceae bacterium]|nr:hypothetical protein [Solirubrobacteraceae bacterium]
MLLLASAAGSLLLGVAAFSTLYSLRVEGAQASLHPSREDYGLLLIALAALGMAVGGARRARPAMAALAALGVLALGIAVLRDLGQVHSTGVIGQQYENATATPDAGFYEETLGGALLLVAGGGLLVLHAPARPERASREPRAARRSRPPRVGDPETATDKTPEPTESQSARQDWFDN